jgi:hypothetical protein
MSIHAAAGPLAKARETLGVFLRSRPSARALLSSRTGTFDRVHAIGPSTVAAGDPVTLTVQAWDEYERLHGFEGRLGLDATDPDAEHPDAVAFPPGSDGVVHVDGVRFREPGVQYLTLSDGEREWPSNPVRVVAGEPAEGIYWGDIHLHSRLSDGTGSIEKGMRFGRDVMRLDVVSYTDHDTMGFFVPPQLQQRRMRRRYFRRMKAVAARFDDPGSFVTLMAYEWTKQPNRGGHVNVYFDDADGAELYDSLSAETDTYEKLWARLREFNDAGGARALSIPHHPAESMYPFDFSAVDYDDDLAPLVEVYSQWGSSERPAREGNRFPLEMGQGEVDAPGHYVQDALRLGYRVGMHASADYHGPHPGHSLIHAPPHLPAAREWLSDGVGWANVWRVWSERSYPGGLTAFRLPELTRAAAFDALRERRVYATSQPHRVLVEFSVDGSRVGEADSTVRVDAPDATRRVAVSVAGTEPLARVTVVKNNEPWRTVEGTDDPDAPLDSFTLDREWTDDAPVEGMRWDDERGTGADVYYLRVRGAGPRTRSDGFERDPALAWAGPLWVEVDSG